MDMLLSIFSSAAASSGVTDVGLSIMIITLLGFLYKYTLLPIHLKVHKIPSESDITKIIESGMNQSIKEISIIVKKLDNIEEKLKTLDNSDITADINMKEIRRDIESVKTILNQFHGHMMYGRRAGNIVNQELK